MQRDRDVVVVGAGFAGLVAAVRALEFTDAVTVLEKAHRVGGTLPVTAGTIAVERERDPVIDVFELIEEGLDWLESQGVDLTVPDDRWLTAEAERVARIDPPAFIDHMTDRIEANGGDIRLETPMTGLRTDDADRIAGVQAAPADDTNLEIEAPSVILATGGFSGNAELIERYFASSDLWNGRHPWCTGDGFQAALEVGGRTTRGLSKALGGFRPAPPAQITEENRREASTVYRNQSLILNEAGERFTDESKHISGSTDLVDEVLANVDERAFIVLDQDVYEAHTGQVANEPQIGTLVDGAERLGAPVAEADSLEALGSALSDMGAAGERAVRTIRTYNDAIRTEDDGLHPPRRDHRYSYDTPPFYAVAVEPSIVYVRGGLDVNQDAQVVSAARSTSNLKYHAQDMQFFAMEPIPGLYAAGVEVGRNADHGYYHLGLSLGLATGRAAGKHAAESAERRQRPA